MSSGVRAGMFAGLFTRGQENRRPSKAERQRAERRKSMPAATHRPHQSTLQRSTSSTSNHSTDSDPTRGAAASYQRGVLAHRDMNRAPSHPKRSNIQVPTDPTQSVLDVLPPYPDVHRRPSDPSPTAPVTLESPHPRAGASVRSLDTSSSTETAEGRAPVASFSSIANARDLIARAQRSVTVDSPERRAAAPAREVTPPPYREPAQERAAPEVRTIETQVTPSLARMASRLGLEEGVLDPSEEEFSPSTLKEEVPDIKKKRDYEVIDTLKEALFLPIRVALSVASLAFHTITFGLFLRRAVPVDLSRYPVKEVSVSFSIVEMVETVASDFMDGVVGITALLFHTVTFGTQFSDNIE